MVLTISIIMVVQVNQLVSIIDASSNLRTTIANAFSPYLGGSIAFFVIGGLCFWVGMRKEPNFALSVKGQGCPFVSDFPSNTQVSYEKISSKIHTSNLSVILCGSCGMRNDSKAVTCERCGGTFI